MGKHKIKACLPATNLEMLASNITKGAYSPYVGNPDLYCGLPCNPCDTNVSVSESVLDSIYAEAKKLYNGLKVVQPGDDAATRQLRKDLEEHMKKYDPQNA